MRNRALALASAVLLALPGAVLAADPPADPQGLARLRDALAPTVVTVKFVLKTKVSFGGGALPDEEAGRS